MPKRALDIVARDELASMDREERLQLMTSNHSNVNACLDERLLRAEAGGPGLMSEKAEGGPFLQSAFFAPRLGLRGKSGAYPARLDG